MARHAVEALSTVNVKDLFVVAKEVNMPYLRYR